MGDKPAFDMEKWLHQHIGIFLNRYKIGESKCPCLSFYGVGISTGTLFCICVMMGVYRSTSCLGVERDTTSEYLILLSHFPR